MRTERAKLSRSFVPALQHIVDWLSNRRSFGCCGLRSWCRSDRLSWATLIKPPSSTTSIRRPDWPIASPASPTSPITPGMPPPPTRLMAGLAILKHTFNLSDEVLCERWVENPYFQYLCGEEFFRHAPPFDF